MPSTPPGRLSKPRASPRQVAIALGYNVDADAAPRVLAKGHGEIARRILELAREKNIPVRDDPDLVQTLAQLDLGEFIPAELYPAVAEVLAFIYRENQRRGRIPAGASHKSRGASPVDGRSGSFSSSKKNGLGI